MRDIKFRAWDVVNHKMIYSDDFMQPIMFHPRELAEFFGAVSKGYKGIMQYTGLKDKNGVEVYEGDKVVYRNNMSVKNPGVEYGSYSEICFGSYEYETYDDYDSGYGWYYKDNNGGGGLRRDIANKWLEVIGNIYENPELLKE